MPLPRLPSIIGFLLISAAAAAAEAPGGVQPGTQVAVGTAPTRSSMILGCWASATTGDRASLKLAFRDDGAMVQYDERQPDQLRRTFGAWEMPKDSTFLTVYWPDGGVTRYNVKRIGPILHFAGMFGVRNFTLHELDIRDCWRPSE
jgi:hypothetical protein